LWVARDGRPLIEDDVIGPASFATNLFLMSALVMDGAIALFSVRVARFVVGQFLRNDALPRRDCRVVLLLLFVSALHRMLLRSVMRSAPALPLLRQRNRDATGQ